jgi:CubicO group peptidase (beta-lactamase class C family)
MPLTCARRQSPIDHGANGDIRMRSVSAGLAACAFFGSWLPAQGSAAASVSVTPVEIASDKPRSAMLTRADLEAWLDGFLPYALGQGDVAGAVVVVVEGGRVLLQKGYGYADVERRRPVDPERTLFRPGSVAKLFTWTAVMQLVEQGKLDLDRDINAYLDFAIPPAFDRPITLRHLMTHTPGFEELLKRLMTSEPARLLPLESYVKASTPTRIFPPGEVPSYCNYGVALAGYIVQRISGESLDDYLERHVFGPLEMHRSTLRQPLPPALAPDLSGGYKTASTPASYFELVGPAPAGSLSSTGADMARFMIAHLRAQDGGGGGLLRPETARLMYSSMFRAAPPSNGMALGFFERSRNGRRLIGHGGDTQFFHSDLLLFIDDGVGLFMSFNSTGTDGAAYRIRGALFDQFADRYFPAPPLQEKTASTAGEHALLVAGTYQSSRRAETSFLAAIGLLGQVRTDANADGTLVIAPLTGLNGQPKVWREVAPFVWREVGGDERLAARLEDGNVRMLGVDALGGIDMLQPVPAWKSSAWIMPTLLTAIVALTLTVLFWPVSAWARRYYGVQPSLTGSAQKSYRLVRVAALVNLVFLAGWLVFLQVFEADLARFDGQLDGWLALVHFLGLVGVAGAAIALWNAWLSFRSNARWWNKAWVARSRSGRVQARARFQLRLRTAGAATGSEKRSRRTRTRRRPRRASSCRANATSARRACASSKPQRRSPRSRRARREGPTAG